jgi:hypothetical protein
MRDMDIKMLSAVSGITDETEPAAQTMVGTELRTNSETNTIEKPVTNKRRTSK